MSAKIKVILVDDHDIFRDGIKSLLIHEDIADVIGEASNGQEFIDRDDIDKADVVLMDISMPILNGVEATRLAVSKYPKLKILVLSMFGEEDYYFKMINAGAKGFVLKSSGIEELKTAIQTVASGESYFSNELLRKIIVHLSDKAPEPIKKEQIEDRISEREIDVLRLICNGLSAVEIGDKLCLSAKTIEGHRAKLMAKTATKNTVSLIVYAIKSGLVTI